MFETLEQGIKRHIRALASKHRKEKVLDVGCGMGDYTYLLGNRAKTIGLDVQNVVKKEFKNFKFIQGSGTNMPFKDGSFDLVVSFDVIEHVYRHAKMVREANRVLKKGGHIFFGTPNRTRLMNTLLAIVGRARQYPLNLGTSADLGPIIHIREYTPNELYSLLKKSGFKKIRVYPYWLRIPPFSLGLKTTPKFLMQFCQYLFVEGYKL